MVNELEHHFKKQKDSFNERAESLNPTQAESPSILLVKPNDRQALELLAKAYVDIYQRTFHLCEEEVISCWVDTLQGKNPHLDIVIVLAGDNLQSTKPTLKGMSIAYYQKTRDIGWLAYNAIDPAHRAANLGRVMVDVRRQELLECAQRNGKSLKAVFFSCADPAKVKRENDSIDPSKRLKIFEKWGARMIDIDYVQPLLHTSDISKDSDMVLMNYPHPKTGTYATAAEVRDYITGIYEAMAYRMKIAAPIQQDPDYIKMMRQIDALPATPHKQKPPAP